MKLALKFQKTDGTEIDICLDQIDRVEPSTRSDAGSTHCIELVSGRSHCVDLAASLETGIPVVDLDSDAPAE